MNYDYDEGSDIDNWEAEQVFQDHEGREPEEVDPEEKQPSWADDPALIDWSKLSEKEQAGWQFPKTPTMVLNMPSETYHAGPGYSSSELKIITARSALHFQARAEVKATPEMREGSVLHAMALEPHTVESRYIFAPGLALNTKKGKEKMKEIQAQAKGREVVRADPDHLWKVAAAVGKHAAWKHLTGLDPLFEASLFWVDPDTSIRLKCRPDALNLQYGLGDPPRALGVDLKSAADARTRAFSRQVKEKGYDFSAAMYCAGITAVCHYPCSWAWFVLEKQKPFATRVITAGPHWLGRGRALYTRALAILQEAEKTDYYPGYDKGLPVELPFTRWDQLTKEN